MDSAVHEYTISITKFDFSGSTLQWPYTVQEQLGLHMNTTAQLWAPVKKGDMEIQVLTAQIWNAYAGS